MPEMGGVEFCGKIKKMHPNTEVVFVSGQPAQTEKQIIDFMDAGGRDEYLRKPLLEDELLSVVRDLAEDVK